MIRFQESISQMDPFPKNPIVKKAGMGFDTYDGHTLSKEVSVSIMFARIIKLERRKLVFVLTMSFSNL